MWKIWDGMVSVNSIKRKWTRLRLRPVRVFCFHHVSDVFEPETMWECDWMQTEVFKKRILTLKEKYTFISLEEAHAHIANDRFRVNNFAVLTSDDGWASLKNILPWLAEEKIPITLFLNPMYMDGKHFQSRDSEVFLTKEEVADLTERYEPFITIASHGWSHEDCLKMSIPCSTVCPACRRYTTAASSPCRVASTGIQTMISGNRSIWITLKIPITTSSSTFAGSASSSTVLKPCSTVNIKTS